MKYMNHLRKLALLSSLALSFTVTVYADGTLPLPLDMTDTAAQLELQVKSVGKIARKPFVQNGVQACAATDEAFDATGTVFLGDIPHTVLGVCKSKLDVKKRTIVTTDADVSRFTVLEGTADDLTSFARFSGTLSHKLLVAPGSISGAESEVMANLKSVKFVLIRRP